MGFRCRVYNRVLRGLVCLFCRVFRFFSVCRCIPNPDVEGFRKFRVYRLQDF